MVLLAPADSAKIFEFCMATVLAERLNERQYWCRCSPSTVEIKDDRRLYWVDRQKAAAYLPSGRLLCRLSAVYLLNNSGVAVSNPKLNL
jgi:hypothetical protein